MMKPLIKKRKIHPLSYPVTFLILLYFLLIIVSPCIYSQTENIILEHFSVDQGMPTKVSCILQDNTGYLWFGTFSGLYKYDGYNFIPYRHDPADTTSIIEMF